MSDSWVSVVHLLTSLVPLISSQLWEHYTVSLCSLRVYGLSVNSEVHSNYDLLGNDDI
jgi:hypothetical protein